jgi:glycine dehydrogenase subunit 1
VGHYVPHTEAETTEMLASMGLSSIDELFASIPAALRLAGGLNIDPGLSEFDALGRMEALAGGNRPAGRELACFAGGGAYDHDVPAAVRRVAFRSEFVTAYTPYQAEVAQGVLQALFEYQTVVCRLTGMDVANASLYDGASAVVEAVNLAVAATGRAQVWLSRGVHPHWRAVAATFAAGTGHDLVDVPVEDGRTAWPSGDGLEAGAVVVQYPNYLGCIEDLSAAAEAARRAGAFLVVVVDPVAAALLKPPSDYGADVVVGEGQPFGTPLSFGGPYLGLFACKREHVRRLPGRLVGETVDAEGRRAYVTTLRTREQDIRREKASSNVCTNQTLIAVACVVQLGWLGTAGLRELAVRCARGTRYAREALLRIDGVEPATAGTPVVREFGVRTPVAGDVIVDRMVEEGFLAGVPLAEEYGGGLLVSVTEKRTRAEIDAYVTAFEKVVG